MGSSQSSRKLTISNEEEVGMIKLSNAIVQRLAQAGEKPTAIESPMSDLRAQNAATHQNSIAMTPTAADTLSEHPVYYYPELTMSALQVQQQKEQELKQQDQYWQKRLQNLELSHQRINYILENEYKKTASEMSSKFGKQASNTQDMVQPCLENSQKVLQCFQDHPKETLKCSNLVQEFSNCVWNVHYTRVIEAR